MEIEYSIKFEKDSLTITQRASSGAQTQPIKFQGGTEQNMLAGTFQASQQASNPSGRVATSTAKSGLGGNPPVSGPRGPGGSPLDSSSSAPITIIGPFLFLCPPHTHDEKANHDN